MVAILPGESVSMFENLNLVFFASAHRGLFGSVEGWDAPASVDLMPRTSNPKLMIFREIPISLYFTILVYSHHPMNWLKQMM